VILGIGSVAIGYAIFYWGLHHFPNVDGGQRYSLFQLLGIPEAWGLWNQNQPPKAIGLTPGGQLTAELTSDTQTQSSENTTTPNPVTSGGSNNSDWKAGILAGIGAPNSANNQHKMTAWNACEGNLAGHSGLGINNPFNITADSYQLATHGTGAVNSAGVQQFATLTAGINGTVAKLQEPFCAAILSNLKNDGDFKAFASAVGSSGWGTSGGCIAGA
jgi:hypothetical protein